MRKICFTGIVNVTPDSFSDGGKFLDPQDALRQIHALRAQGANLIELGADSTRPGSECIGEEEEWRRLEPILKELENFSDIAVDTHRASIAGRAIECGVRFINDVFPGSDPEMFPLVASTGVNYLVMHSRCERPHLFSAYRQVPIVSRVNEFFEMTLEALEHSGVRSEQVVLDPGYGKFVSDEPADSFQILSHFDEFERFGLPLCIATSRKGFLKQDGEGIIEERDALSALTAICAAAKVSVDVYVRAHNIPLHQQFFSMARLLSGSSLAS